jgi:hypothetical protein
MAEGGIEIHEMDRDVDYTNYDDDEDYTNFNDYEFHPQPFFRE